MDHVTGHPSLDDLRRKAGILRDLHRADDILVLVNVWDVASVHAVQAAGRCAAIATASAAVSAAAGFEDGEHLPVGRLMTTLAEITSATDLPVTADLEAGYGDVGASVTAAIRAGVVGGNIEDRCAPLPQSRQAVRDALAAAREVGVPFVLNARTDVILRGADQSNPEVVDDVLRRGVAYLEEGAECVFVPGVTDRDTITRLVAGLGRGHLSLMGGTGCPAPAELHELGVARVSYGPFPQRAAMAALTAYAAERLGPQS